MDSTRSHKSPPRPLDVTLGQLKEALDRWQNLSSQLENRDASSAKKNLSNEGVVAPDNEWLEETRALLTKLGQQLDGL